jgi:hypothetical protein
VVGPESLVQPQLGQEMKSRLGRVLWVPVWLEQELYWQGPALKISKSQ